MHLFNRAFLTPALVTLAAAPLAAQVKIHLEPASLLPGQSAELHACLDGSWWQPDWTWSLAGPDNGRVQRGADGIWRYMAAEDFLLAPRKVRLRAAPADGSHPPVETALTLCVRPPLDKLVYAGGFFPGPLGEPVASLLAGNPWEEGSADGTAQQARFKRITRLAWIGDHPDPDLAGKWLLADYVADRLLVMDGAGTVRPWLAPEPSHPGEPQSCIKGIRALSVRPAGAGPWRAVLASTDRNVILAVDGKGQVTPLAGRPGVKGCQDGEAGSACFNMPMDVVAGLDGVVYVADTFNYRIRMIKDGMVSTLAGRKDVGWQDGKGDQALFQFPSAIAQDPVTGHLYVLDGKRLCRVTRAGEVTTLAGGERSGFESWRSGPSLPAGAARLRGIPCLNDPRGLTVHRNKLYIAEYGNHAVRVLDLDTFDLATLAGDPRQTEFRPGPLRGGRPRDPERFAALPNPAHVAFDDLGHCLVATSQRGACLAELSLAGVLPEPADGKAGGTEPALAN